MTNDERPKAGTVLTISFDRLEDDGSASAPLSSPVDDFRVHAHGALPGETREVRLAHVSRQRPVAWAVQAPYQRDINDIPCHHAAPLRGACGGCPWMHVPDRAQEAEMQERMTTIASRLRAQSTATSSTVEPALHRADQHLGWRNRTNLLAFRGGSGTLHLGSRRRGGKGYARMRGCRVVTPAIQRATDTIEAILRDSRLPVAAFEGKGLRWVSARSGSDDVLVRISHDLPQKRQQARLRQAIESSFESIGASGVLLCHHDGPLNQVHGGEVHDVIGSPSLRAARGTVAYELGPDTFFQLNDTVSESIVDHVVAWLGGDAPLWDVYSGVGTFGNALSLHHGATVHCIESVSASVQQGRRAAAAAGIDTTFHEVDLRENALLLRTLPTPGGVVLDPPRRGLSPEVSDEIVEAAPRRIAHVGCSQEPFARDVTHFLQRGYVLRGLHAWELLPLTGHLEWLALLERNDTA